MWSGIAAHEGRDPVADQIVSIHHHQVATSERAHSRADQAALAPLVHHLLGERRGRWKRGFCDRNPWIVDDGKVGHFVTCQDDAEIVFTMLLQHGA